MMQKSEHFPTTVPDRVLALERTFACPRTAVFDAWTNPEKMKQWSAPDGFTIPESSGDLRPGGKWRACMHSPHCGDLRLGGTYIEIVQNERLVFTHAWEQEDGSPGPETTVHVSLSDDAGGTRMRFEQGVFASAESRDSHAGGWDECMKKLETLLRQSSSDSQP